MQAAPELRTNARANTLGVFRVRRILLPIALALLAGFLFQLILAYALYFRAGGASITTLNAAAIARPLDIPVARHPDGSTWGPPISEGLWSIQSFGVRGDASIARIKTPSGASGWGQLAWIECGWPWPSLERRWARLADDPSWPHWKDSPNGPSGWAITEALPTPAGQTIALTPNAPLWRGALFNTLAWGLALLIVTRLILRARRGWLAAEQQVRREAGLCTACGYPRADSGVCPECGRPSDS